MRRALFVIVLAGVVTSASAADYERWLPVAASNPGMYGTMWTTDAWVFTPVVDATIDVTVAFFPTSDGTTNPTEVIVQVPAGRSLEITDIVGTLFNEARPGALRFRSQYPFDVQSRTYNYGGSNGTFGQGIRAFDPADTMMGWILLGAANIPGSDGVRTNLGLVNTTDEAGDGLVIVIDDDTGSLVGQEYVDIGPYGWMQTDVFDLVGASDSEVPRASVLCVFFSGLRGYMSRVDNLSGDGVYSEPFEAESVYTVPVEWEVIPTLTFTTSTTIDTLTYTGEDGSDVTVENPSSGWTATLHYTSPAEFCYLATGTVNGDSGQVTMTILAQRAGDQGRQFTATTGTTSGPIEIEDCIELF